jgi:hypothetical protein
MTASHAKQKFVMEALLIAEFSSISSESVSVNKISGGKR